MQSHDKYLLEDPGIEVLLELLIAIVDTELLKTVHLEVLWGRGTQYTAVGPPVNTSLIQEACFTTVRAFPNALTPITTFTCTCAQCNIPLLISNLHHSLVQVPSHHCRRQAHTPSQAHTQTPTHPHTLTHRTLQCPAHRCSNWSSGMGSTD